MNNFIVFNSACSKCNITLNYIKDKKFNFEIINYLDGELSKDKAQYIFDNIKDKAALLREISTPDEFEEFYGIIVSNPAALQRPIIAYKGDVFVNRPADIIENYL